MVDVIKLCHQYKLQLGQDIGLITYNDAAVKEVLEGGITTVAIDFKKMGRVAAQKILNKENGSEIIPAQLIIRKSL